MKLTLAVAILAVTTVFAASADEEDVVAKFPARPRPPPRPQTPKPPLRPAPSNPPVRPAPVNSAPATDLTNCFWSGTAPFCAGGCSSPYTEQSKDGCGDGACCVTGYKAHCCK